MSEILIENKAGEEHQVQLVAEPHPSGDVVHQRKEARASKSKIADEIPAKRRKTRRGKSKKGKLKHPYNKPRSKHSDMKFNNKKPTKVIKPEAPYNSNQFLLEDHGDLEQLDEDFKHADQFSSATNRSRESSFSSEGEFYSSPDDEEQFLIKDFVDQYESVQAERLHSMSKEELIQEYLILESRLEIMSKRLGNGNCFNSSNRKDGLENGENDLTKEDLKKEIEKLKGENESLRRENDSLRNKSSSSGGDTEDSETDSSDSCSSSSSSSGSSRRADSPLFDYVKTNGHSAEVETV